MKLRVPGFLSIVLAAASCCAQQTQPIHPFDYEAARAHEIKPHRRTIPHQGISSGFNQLRLTLIISPAGDVVETKASGDAKLMEIWPELEGEVRAWQFKPFEENGHAVTAEVEEYIDMVPPERLPEHHRKPPVLSPDSHVVISLQRTGCLGTCPAYTVSLSTDGRIVFDRLYQTIGDGKHFAAVKPDRVRELAKRFIDADFYSMEDSYIWSATDLPSYILTISVDGNDKKVVDYEGQMVGMPSVIADLEEDVDMVSDSQRWVEYGEGLVDALKGEHFSFQTFDAQTILKSAALQGKTDTVRELLEAGVPLKSLPVPKSSDPDIRPPFENIGWLNAASKHPDTLQLLIDARASRNDQADKDLALVNAAESGSLESLQALIAYGANPNADLRKLIITHEGGGMMYSGPGRGSVLIYAAESGNPDVVREILRYHPRLEARGTEGKTALFGASDSRSTDKVGARVECVRLLVQAGANVNAHDDNGNTPLHETFLTDVEEELLKSGAAINARNDDGETPIFTTVDNDAIPLFISHGADLTIRNKKGRTVIEAAAGKGPLRQQALLNAVANMKHL